MAFFLSSFPYYNKYIDCLLNKTSRQLQFNARMDVQFKQQSILIQVRSILIKKWNIVKVKIEAPRHEDVWGSGCIAPPFLASALDGDNWSASRPGRFSSPSTRERAPVSIV
jgi:hypothetical protein